MNFKYVILEGDNLTLINSIKRIWHVPWEISTRVMDIVCLLSASAGSKVFHCFRECNRAADLLASRRASSSDIPSFNSQIRNWFSWSLPDVSVRVMRWCLSSCQTSSHHFFSSSVRIVCFDDAG